MRISLAFILFFAYLAVAQKPASKMQLDSLAITQIRQLHDGALLVRLHSKKTVIDALIKRGLTKQAGEIEKQQLEINEEIREAFKAAFNFCPVYFFYSENSNLVLEKRFDTAFFLNADLKLDTTIHFSARNFLCAEVGNRESEVAYKREPFYYVPNDKAEAENAGYFDDETKSRKGGPASYSRNESLLIQDEKFVQLQAPFPFHQRTKNAIFTIEMSDVVKYMNDKLRQFYDSCKGMK